MNGMPKLPQSFSAEAPPIAKSGFPPPFPPIELASSDR